MIRLAISVDQHTVLVGYHVPHGLGLLLRPSQATGSACDGVFVCASGALHGAACLGQELDLRVVGLLQGCPRFSSILVSCATEVEISLGSIGGRARLAIDTR